MDNLTENGKEIRVLYLTNTPIMGGTARILESWLPLGPAHGIRGFVGVQRLSDFTRWLETQEIAYTVNGMPWPSKWAALRSIWAAWRLARWARQKGIDIIHFNEHNLYPFAVLLRRFLRRPVVCHVRFSVGAEFSRWAFGSKWRQPDALLWTSQQQKDDCFAAINGVVPAFRQHVIRLGVNLRAFGTLAEGREETRAGWDIRPHEIVIGTACALRPIKRVHEFIELVARLAEKDARIVGLIAGNVVKGDESYRDQLVEQIQKTGLGRRCRWLGHLEPIEPFHHALDVFVSTSEYETFGNSVCEAMACRRAVAAYCGGSVHEVVGDTGRVVATGDLRALTAAVAELVGNPELRRYLGDLGRARVAEHFSPVKSLQELRKVYLSLLDNHRRLRLSSREKASFAKMNESHKHNL